MPTLSSEIATLNSPSLANQAHNGALERHIHALVVSPRLEVRKPLLHALEDLSVDCISCSNRAEADEVLSHQSFEVVFCDESLPDGCYSDFIHSEHFEHRTPRVIVATRAGEWELYFEATRKGAFDVIRSPWYPTDIEMAVIRALHEEGAAQAAASA